jgi:signal peptidase I
MRQLDGRRGQIAAGLRTVVLGLLLALGIRAAVVEAFVIPSGSMEPTLQIGDRVLASKFWFWLSDPRQQQIVIFASPPAAGLPSHTLIKRVVAVEGDVVEIADGQVRVNDRPLAEPYLKERPGYVLPPTPVPAGKLFVLGDNRNASYDSHVWGFVPREALRAKAFFRYWPVDRIGLLQ